MSASSVEAFLADVGDVVGGGQGIVLNRGLGGAGNWRVVSQLKSEVDRLVGCDLSEAARLADRLEQLAAAAGDKISTAFASASRARVFHHAGDYAKANALYASVVVDLRAARLTTEAGIIQKHQVDALTQMGRCQDAFRASRSARRALNGSDPVQMAQLESNVGNIYYRLDRYKQALKHYDRAHEIL